jgi:hypothetical protein
MQPWQLLQKRSEALVVRPVEIPVTAEAVAPALRAAEVLATNAALNSHRR